MKGWSSDGCQLSKLLGIADSNWIPMYESQGIYNILIVNLILQILILLENCWQLQIYRHGQSKVTKSLKGSDLLTLITY